MDTTCHIYCLLLFIMMHFKSGVVDCLECWVCIGESCSMSPSQNYKVKIKTCKEGQSCQKVEYTGRDQSSNKEYHSVVRSCSQGQCRDRRDNCTDTLITNPGCTDRVCCNDHLCNTATSLHRQYYYHYYSRTVWTVCFVIVVVLLVVDCSQFFGCLDT